MGILRKLLAFMGPPQVVLLFVWVALCGPADAAALQLQEQKIKAGLLYNFIKYSTWPTTAFSAPEEPFNICLLGGDAFDSALDPLQGRPVQQRNINIHKIADMTPGLNCHVVFVNQSVADHWPALRQTLESVPVLSISDIPGFSRQGGMVEFAKSANRRIELHLNKPAIADAGLQIGDSLVKLATE